MATMDKIKIAAVVLNYNGLANSLACIDSLRRLEKDNFGIEIIVVDNASTDGSQEALSNLKDIYLVTIQENSGYTGGNNMGVKVALKREAQYVLILNNDTIVHQNLILELMGAIGEGDIISPKIYFAKGYEFHKNRYQKKDLGKVIWAAGATVDWQNIIGKHIGVDEVDRGQFDMRKQIDFATGACMFVTKSVFARIGFFDEKYFLYLEDMDFCFRAKKARLKILYEPKAIIWHKNAGSVGGSGSKLQDYYITRNRLLFSTKYAKLRTKFALFRQIISQSRSSVKRKALIDFLTLNFGKCKSQL